eukprot:2445176-Prymnesium_polylepis.1
MVGRAASRLLAAALAACAYGVDYASPVPDSLESLGQHVDNSYLRELQPDPEMELHAPNTLQREVSSGHYVLVAPTPLPLPYVVACSADVAALLSLDPQDCTSRHFARLFSGDISVVPAFSSSWATPYALSIYGGEVQPNGAGPRGYGYGDGRAVSIGEVYTDGGERWELQLKGGGKTPFCRGSDGRAVLRSSTREFLASEAMAALGVPTTRALSLVASARERVNRPWYANQSAAIALGAQAGDKHGGDIMRAEPVAITTRVARSFLRVGQFELYGRRARRGEKRGREELEQLARHALRR